MSDGNYERILGIICRTSGLSREDVEKKIDAKREKISGMVSKEGAAQIVAAELGVNIENQKIKIKELSPGLKRVNFSGKVMDIFPVRTFTKNDKESKVVNMIVADSTSNIKVVLWDTNHIELIETGKIGKDSVVEFVNGSVRDNEVHLGSFSEVRVSNEVIENVKTERETLEKNISDLKISDNVNLRAFVVQTFEPRFFYVCPECKKKATNNGEEFVCEQHGRVVADKRALINLVLDDGTGTIRTVLFHDNLGEIGFHDLENVDSVIRQREEILGKEIVFTGNVRMNKFFNEAEFIANKVFDLNVEEIISKMEN
jgi:replication factor A1